MKIMGIVLSLGMVIAASAGTARAQSSPGGAGIDATLPRPIRRANRCWAPPR